MLKGNITTSCCFLFPVLIYGIKTDTAPSSRLFLANMSLDRLQEQRIVGIEWQMERGDWCSLWWVDSGHTGSATIAAFPLGCPEPCATSRCRERRGWPPNTSVLLAVWKYTGLLFVRESSESRLSWKVFIVVDALRVCLQSWWLWLVTGKWQFDKHTNSNFITSTSE